MAEQAGAGQGSAASESSLGDEISALLGDESLGVDDAESQSVETTDAAGAPPAERQATTGEAQAAPEGQGKDARAGEPPVDATKAGLDKGAAPTKEGAEEDPLAGSKPFTYTVNGQEKTVDGITVLAGGGAIVLPEALELLQRRVGERDNLYEQNKSQYDQIQDFGRLSEWRTLGADGKTEQTISGREGLVAMRTGFAQLEASFNTMVSAFKPDAQGNYSLLAQLIDVDPKTNQIIVNPEALTNLLTRAELAEARATETVRSRLAEISAPKQTTSGPSAGQATPVDYSALTAEAPRVIEMAAKEIGVDAKLLNEKDRAFLGQQLPRYLRTVTEDDRRENINLKVGAPIIDQSFTQVVKDRADLRKEMATTAAATSSAARENATRIAAAALGTRQATPSTSRTQERQPTVESDRISDADAAWKLREKLSSGRF